MTPSRTRSGARRSASTRAPSARQTPFTSTSRRPAARAAREATPVSLDVEAAGRAGSADVVAPPMFAVVYSAPSVGPPIFDPEIGLNFAMMVHGGQVFEWGAPVVGGHEVTTATSIKDISERDGRGYYTFESISTNQRGEQVCRGTWTNIVRGV